MSNDKLIQKLRELQGVIAPGGITRLPDSEIIRQAAEALAAHASEQAQAAEPVASSQALTPEQDKEDAERYRWLRDVSVPPHNFYISVPVEFDGVRYTPAEVDAAIDAARALAGGTK